MQLYGPFSTRAAITCSGRPFWSGRVVARGDGVLNSPRVRVPRAGFYTYRERIAGTDVVIGTETECGLVAQTTLARPLIVTGRGDVTRPLQTRPAAGAAPARVRVAALGIDALSGPFASTPGAACSQSRRPSGEPGGGRTAWRRARGRARC